MRNAALAMSLVVLGCVLAPGGARAQNEREWIDAGTTNLWSEADNWSPAIVPGTGAETTIGSHPDGRDDTVLFDRTSVASRTLDLRGGADVDTNGQRLFVTETLKVGTFFLSSATDAELIVRPTTLSNSVDVDAVTVGSAGQVTMLGGHLQVDGTNRDGALELRSGAVLYGHGLLELSDLDDSLAPFTPLLINSGLFRVGDPEFGGVGVEPPAVRLDIQVPNATSNGVIDFAAPSLRKKRALLGASSSITPLAALRWRVTPR